MPLNYSSSKKKKSTTGSTSSKSSVKNSGLTNLGRMIAENDPQAIWSVQRRTERQDRLDDVQRRFNEYLARDAWNNRLATLDGPIAGPREEKAYWQSKLKSSENSMRSAQSRLGYNDNAVFDPAAKRDYESAKRSRDLAKRNYTTLAAQDELLNSGAYDKQAQKNKFIQGAKDMSYENLLATINSGYLTNEQRQWGEDILREKANSTQAKSRSDYYNAEADKLEAELAERYATGYDGTPEGGYLYGQSLKMVDNLRNMAKQYDERGWMAERLELGDNAKNSPTYEQDYMMVPNRAYNREYQALFGLVSDDDLSTKDEISAARRREVMTDEEKYNYSAIYNTQGAEKAHDYLDALGYELDQRLQTQKTEAVNARLYTIRNAENAIPDTGIKWLDDYIEKSAKQNMEAGWFLEARANNVASGMGALDALWQGVTSGGVRPVNWNTESFTPHTVSQAIQENQLNQIDSSVGRFAYQTAGSMVDSLVVMGATVLGVPGATAILGGAAATDSMLKAKERGATDSQALSVGLLSGVAEALFEQVSLEKLLTAGTPATLKEVIKNMLFRQGVTEASEEVFTTIANTISDAILMGDKSELRTKIRQYVEQGYSQSDAEKLGAIDWFKDLGMDALGGFVSGAIFGGFEQGASYGGFRSDMSNLQNSRTTGAAVDNYSAAMQRVLDENGEVRKDSANAAKRLQETYQQTMEGLSDRSTRYEEISHVIDQQVEQGQMAPEDAIAAKAFVEFSMGEQAYNQKTQEQRAKQAEELDQKARGMVQNMAEKSTATISSTQSIVDNYDSSIANPSDYFGAFRYYEEMGQQARATGNDNFAEVWKNDERYSQSITQQAAMVAFAAGKTTAAPASKIMQVTQRGTGTLTYSDEAMKQLANNVKSVNDAVELLSAFAKKTGFTVNLDESLADGENAKFIANAMTIAINPRANVIAGLFHESGHAVQRFNPQDYAQLKADMISWYAQTQGMTNMDQMLKQYGKAYKGYSRDALEVEMTNDAFGALFNRADAAEDIANWLTANKTEAEQKSFIDKLNALIDRIINWVNGLVNYEGVSPMQKKTIDMQVEKAQAFRKAFLDALDKAAESARMATEYRVDVDATQYDSVAASKSMIDFSLNIATLNYAETYTADSDDAKEKLSTLGDTLETLWAIEQEIKKGEGKTSHSIHDINKYLESHPDIHQRLLDIQKAANDAGITCDFVTPIGEEVKVEGKKVAPGLKGLPIEYVEAAEGSSKYVERTSDEYRHEGYKFTAFKRTIPQMFLDSVPANVRETVRTELVKAVEDAYEKGKGSTILTDIDKAFPSIKEIKAVAGPSTRGNIYNKTMSGVQAPLRSAEKTVMALNLNSACPMFTIGNHGCYLDACYLTQMANGATGTNLFRTAWYTGELLQLNDEAIATMNALGGLRINGVGDTTMDNVSQLLDVLKHAQMRGLNVKIITKQATTFDMLSQAKKAGIKLPNITVQPSMDNLWIPATLDDVYGAGVRGKTQLAETVKKGNLDAAAEAYDEFFGRATKEVDGVLYRKYGFSPEQVQQMMERAQKEFPEVTVTPRYVVCTPEEIAEIALNKNKFVVNGGAIIQTLMHGKVPEGCISDYGTTIVNFGGLRHVIERKNGVWDFYGVTVKEGKDANGNKTTIIKRASGKNSPYQAVLDYVNGTVDGKPRFTDMEKAKIWFTLKETMCCQANESKDACAGCSSLCASGATLMNVKARQSDTLHTVEEGDVLPNWVEKTEEITTDYSLTIEEAENARQFADDIDEWDSNGRIAQERFILGSTGTVLQGLGAIESDIFMESRKIEKILEKHKDYGVNLDIIKKIPQILADPILVLQNHTAKDPNRLVLFGDVMNSNGQPVMASMELRPVNNGFLLDNMQMVVTAFAKTTKPYEYITNSNVLYADKKRTASLLRTIGKLKAPIPLQHSGFTGNITYNGPVVNIKGVPFSDLLSSEPANVDYSRTVEDINDEYMEAVASGDEEAQSRLVAEAAKQAGFGNAIPEQTATYKVRTIKPPTKTKKVYKVFTVDANGNPSALFVSSAVTLPQNVWLDAQDTFHFTDLKNGHQYVPSTKNPNTDGGATGRMTNLSDISSEDLQELEKRGYIKRGDDGEYTAKSITSLAYRPGWHAGDLPFFPQGGMKIAGSNYENVHRYNQVVFECEIAADEDYTATSTNKKGQIVFHDRQEMPTNGMYKFATNPMTQANDLGSWYISGSLKIVRALTEEECNKILQENGRLPQEWQAYQDKEYRKSLSANQRAEYEKSMGALDLSRLGYTGQQFDAARKTLAPITYDDDGNVIPLTERFNPEIDDVRYSRGDRTSLTDTERRTLEKRVREAERNAAKEKQRAEHFKSEMRLTPKFTPDATQISELATEISTMFGGADVDTASIEKSLRDIFWNINEANSSGKEARAYAALDLAQQVAETVVNASVSGDMTTTLEGKMMKNEVVAMGANAIMDRILQTRMAKSTAADKWNAKLQETRKALGQTETYAAKEAKRADRLESELSAYKQKMADQIAFLKAKADADHAFNRQAYEQRIARVRAQRDIALREQKEYYKGRIGELSEQKRVAKIMPKVKKEVDALRKMLLSPDEKTYKYVPDIVKSAVSDFLSCVDFVTRTMAETGAALKSDAREVTKLDAIRKLAEQAKDMQNSDVDADYFLDLPSDTVEVIDLLRDRVTSLVGVLQEAQSAGLIDSEIHVRTADSTTLEIIRKLARTINHAVTNINKNYVQGRFAHVDDGARATVQFLDGVKRSEHYHRSLGNSLLWSMSTPYYAFHRFGDGGQAVFENLGAGLAQFAKNIKTILNFVDETFTRAEQREWANQTVTVNATNAQGEEQTLTMTATQLMSLYCLARREAAQNHLYTGGITLQETKAGKTTISQEQAVHLTPESLFSAFDQLSDRQKEVAQKLQEFMSTVGSDWGNEVSMKRWGVNAFEEQFYFPMKTSDNGRATLKANDDDASSLYGMVNQGFTKHLQTNANNALVIDDVFSVFTDHSANMAKYNAMVLPLLDAMKWYNWTQRADTTTAEGDFHRNDVSVKGAIKEAFGTGATQYFRQFIADLNSAKQEGGAGFDIGSRLMSHYKAASVGANLRVALLQPTAFFRAGMLLSPTDLARGAAMRGGQEEMLKHSGIAQWKDLGFYDTDVGRSVRRQIQGERTKVAEARNKIVDVSMKAAEWGDKITWAALWNACKIEQQRQNKGVSYEELMRLTEKRFNEVVFATQVFDSTLSRSEVMRKRDPYHKIITAFMSEPTLSYNMVLDKFMQYSIDAQKLGKGKAWAKHGGMITKSLAVYTVTNLVAALAESIMDAYRDDDDEPWLEKFMEKFFGDWSEVDDVGSAMKALYSGNFMADMTVIGKIPLAKDVISLIQGYDIGGRMDTMAIQNIANLIKIWDEKYSLYTGKLDKPTEATWYGNMTMYGAIYKSLQALSQFIGVPLYNFMRDITPVYNDTIGSLTGFKLDTYQSTQERTRNTMKEQYGMTPEEEEFAKENDLTKPFMEKHYTKEYENLGTTPKKAGIPLDVLTDYSNRVADAGATKKEEIMQIIDSMSIDNAMKDKLYLIKYKESKISEAPWH